MVGVRPGKSDHQEGLGARLTAAREQQYITLEDAVRDLHIPIKQLVALEAEDFSVFSAELYARGAYRAYATYLGVYSTFASREFYRTLTHVRQRVPLKMHTPETFFDSLMNPRTIFIAGCVGIALSVGGYIAWQVQSFWRLPYLMVSGPVSHVIDGMDAVITGRAEKLTRVTINGEAVLLREDASFSVPLILRHGINPIRVEATNAAGRVRTHKLFLLRAS